jgi:hypothetical protein
VPRSGARGFIQKARLSVPVMDAILA